MAHKHVREGRSVPESVAHAAGLKEVKEESPTRGLLDRPSPRRLLDVDEVAAYIGLSPHTVYAMVSQRRCWLMSG